MVYCTCQRLGRETASIAAESTTAPSANRLNAATTSPATAASSPASCSHGCLDEVSIRMGALFQICRLSEPTCIFDKFNLWWLNVERVPACSLKSTLPEIEIAAYRDGTCIAFLISCAIFFLRNRRGDPLLIIY